MYHSFFIHSSVDGYLGCIHVLAIINSAAMNIWVHVSFSIMAFLGYMPSSGTVGIISRGSVSWWVFNRVVLLLYLVSAGALSWDGSGPLHHLPLVAHLGFLSTAAEFWEDESQDVWRKAAAFAQGTGSKFGGSLTLPSSGQNQLHSSPYSRTRTMDYTFQGTWTHWEIGMDIYPLLLFSH